MLTYIQLQNSRQLQQLRLPSWITFSWKENNERYYDLDNQFLFGLFFLFYTTTLLQLGVLYIFIYIYIYLAGKRPEDVAPTQVKTKPMKLGERKIKLSRLALEIVFHQDIQNLEFLASVILINPFPTKDVYICPDLIKGAFPDPSLK